MHSPAKSKRKNKAIRFDQSNVFKAIRNWTDNPTEHNAAIIRELAEKHPAIDKIDLAEFDEVEHGKAFDENAHQRWQEKLADPSFAFQFAAMRQYYYRIWPDKGEIRTALDGLKAMDRLSRDELLTRYGFQSQAEYDANSEALASRVDLPDA